jgi:hypothetical protein
VRGPGRALTRPPRRTCAIGLAIVGLAIVPSVSCAATVTVRTTPDVHAELIYVAAPGEHNDVAAATDSNERRLKITDPGADIAATGACRSIDAHSAVCRGLGGRDPFLYNARVVLGDLDDRVMIAQPSGELELMAEGGPGDDVLKGAANETSEAVLNGGDGNDQLYAGRLNSTLRGGNGNDKLYGLEGSDELNWDEIICQGEWDVDIAPPMASLSRPTPR